MMKHIKELKVRAHVVHGLARLYIHRHIDNLDCRPEGREIQERARKLLESAEQRINQYYPAEKFDRHEGVIDELTQMVEDVAARWKQKSRE